VLKKDALGGLNLDNRNFESVTDFHSVCCRDISIEIDDGSAMVNAMGAQKAKD
jgi:hypothetical protein